MGKDEMSAGLLSEAQREWLAANRMGARERWAYTENSRPFIDELVAADFMRAVSGEFTMQEPGDQTAEVLGRTLPVMTMISLYTLTQAGRAALQACTPQAPNEQRPALKEL